MERQVDGVTGRRRDRQTEGQADGGRRYRVSGSKLTNPGGLGGR